MAEVKPIAERLLSSFGDIIPSVCVEAASEIHRLEAERAALAARVQEMGGALGGIQDGPDPLASCPRRVRCGVEDRDIKDRYDAAEYGYDALQYCAFIAKQALVTPDTSAQILARRDAAVWSEAAEVCRDICECGKAEGYIPTASKVLAALRAKHDELMEGAE